MMIRSAEPCDAQRLLAIYGYYVENTAVTFEYEIPSQEEFAGRIAQTLKEYPWLVLEENGIIQGYAYAGAFRSRAAYAHCCELSIYLDRYAHGKGYGRLLYASLEHELRNLGKRNLYACIASPITEDPYLTAQSERFHSHLGFKTVGVFHECGYKFGRRYNMIYMEKIIGLHD